MTVCDLVGLLAAMLRNVYEKKKKVDLSIVIIMIIIIKQCQSTVTNLLYFYVTPFVCSQ
jgi:hypothetical protein